MNIKSKRYKITLPAILIIIAFLIIYFNYYNMNSSNTDISPIRECELSINNIDIALNRSGTHTLKLNLSASSGYITITNMIYHSLEGRIKDVKPPLPLYIYLSNYTLVNITLFDSSLVYATPKPYESPTRALRFFTNYLMKEEQYLLSIYYIDCMSRTRVIKVNLSRYIIRFIKYNNYTLYDFTVRASSYGGMSLGSVIENRVELTIKSLSNYTIHIDKIHVYLYVSKYRPQGSYEGAPLPHKKLKSKKTYDVNITLPPYGNKTLTLYVDVPLRYLGKNQILIFVHCREGVTRVAATSL